MHYNYVQIHKAFEMHSGDGGSASLASCWILTTWSPCSNRKRRRVDRTSTRRKEVIAERTKIVFSIGFLFGVLVVSILNYLTFLSPRWYRGADGSLTAHDPSFSGFSFDMYMDGYVADGFLAGGFVGNVAVGLAISVAFGWIATIISARKDPRK